MKTILLTTGIITLLAATLDPQPVRAADFELTPVIGYAAGGAFQDAASGAVFEIEESRNYGLMLDIYQTDDTRIELYYNRQRTRVQSGGRLFVGEPLFNLDVQYFHLGGTHGYGEGNVKPFVVGTFGATHMDPKGEGLAAETKLSLSLGGGVKLMPSDRIGVRLEGRWFGTFIDGAGSLFCVDGSCEVHVQGDMLSQFVVNAGLVLAF
jgi:opacity protein-like surface antigen